ncbi:MAG: UDPGP type 1 family protein [Planctomycetaceae bacterium]
MSEIPQAVIRQLQQFDQQHVLTWWAELSSQQQADLLQQLNSLDLQTLTSVWQTSRGAEVSDTANKAAHRIAQAKSPQNVIRQPQTTADELQRQQAAELGEAALGAGRVAVITVAGGQGSRLGFDLPKGMFPIGPITDRTLFQIFAEQILARQRRHSAGLPWLLMTSSATHADTVRFFEQQNYFGLDRADVHFFQQGSLPAMDLQTGRLLMADRAHLCLSPDGHGGLVTALESSGLMQAMSDRGVDHFFYHQVDNPTAILCDPVLIGLHLQAESELTTNVVRKLAPTERMGVLVDVGGHLEIIEYSELNETQAAATDDSGQWIFWAGNTAIHVFCRKFLERIAAGSGQLALHVANKKVPCLDENGQPFEPETPNAAKFERFIFDALPLAANALIVEGNRGREFNPVKNADGNDSPATCRAALKRIAQQWLQSAGCNPDLAQSMEISPLQALDEQEFATGIRTGRIRL